MEGYRAWHVLQRLQHEVVQFNPDMVIVLAGWNDLYSYDPNKYGLAQDPMVPQKLKDHWFNQVILKSYVVKLLVKKALAVVTQPREPQAGRLDQYRTFIPVGSMENYRVIVQEAKSAGIPWVVLGTHPSIAGAIGWRTIKM